MALNFEAVKHACAVLPAAIRLVGDANATELAQFATVAERLAEEHGVSEAFVELAAAMVEDGLPEVPSRLAAYWAARRFYGVDPRLAQELASGGLSEFEISVQQAAFEADREEAETRRFYREEFPGVAAARGQLVEESPAWQLYGGAVGEGPSVVSSTFRTERNFELHELPRLLQVDWSADRIRDEYRRWWTTAERRFWDAEYAAAKPHAADELEAARFATRRVLDRRIAAGSRQAQHETTAAAGAGA